MNFIQKEKILRQEDNILFLSPENKAFEDVYIHTRQKEGWLYDVKSVQKLPVTDKQDPLYDLWKIRKVSADKFIKYLETKDKVVTMLEVGCGNGWFTGMLATHFPEKQFAGLDINKTELQIAADAFQQHNIRWIYGDLLANIFQPGVFDMIIFNASIQYFEDVAHIIRTALQYLKQNGELHILDSPFYTKEQHTKAVNATKKYYSSLGATEMASYYFHHNEDVLHAFNMQFLYRPGSLSKMRSYLSDKSYDPFPWIRILK